MINQEEHLFSLIKRLYQRVDDDLTLDTPFRRAISDRIDYYLGGIPRQRRWLEQDNDLDRPATVAERFRVKYRKEFEWMRMRGMFVRMLADRLNYREIPIRNLVSIQVCAGLAAAEGLRQ
jgi:hypothetical protein